LSPMFSIEWYYFLKIWFCLKWYFSRSQSSKRTTFLQCAVILDNKTFSCVSDIEILNPEKCIFQCWSIFFNKSCLLSINCVCNLIKNLNFCCLVQRNVPTQPDAPM
jgi:hypothetical protein